MKKLQYGLTETPIDDRDFALGAMYKLPSLDGIPRHFVLPFIVRDQKDSDFCTAYVSTAVSYVQEDVELEPSYSFAISKNLQGDTESWGCDLRTAMKAHLNGALPTDETDFNVNTKPTDFLRRIKNWPSHPNARMYRKKSYFKITGQHDHFDNCRAILHKTQTPIAMGIVFGYNLGDTVLHEIKDNGYGHALTIIGTTILDNGENALIILNSYGEKAGDKGIHYITRKVLNNAVERYGAYTFVDIKKEDAQFYLDNGIQTGDNWLIMLWKVLKTLLRMV